MLYTKHIAHCSYGKYMGLAVDAHLVCCGLFLSRIEKEGLTERAIILCKLNKSLLESSISVGIHRQKSLYYIMNLCT